MTELSAYSKARIALRYWLHGAGYFRALEAMDFASPIHTGVRKDSVTPEFEHQVRIASYVRTLPNLVQPETTITTVFLHDVIEDYDVEPSEIGRLFGHVIEAITWRLTKTFMGVAKSDGQYYADLASCPVASIAKAADRNHNLSSMVGVFTAGKQREYVVESENYVLPMLKEARRRFPAQEAAYENARLMLSTQLRLIRLMSPADP